MQGASKKTLVEAAYGRATNRTPIWFLRQAGRYLPEYREIRSRNSFLEMCMQPDVAAEITLQPMRRFDLDAAIIFADILLIPTVMGQTLTFAKDHGPCLSAPVRSSTDVARLRDGDAARKLGYVGEAIAKVKAQLRPDQAMIGFAGAPFTVASYMVEGGGSKDYTELKRFAYTDAAGFKTLLDRIADQTQNYIAMQVKAGADVAMLFDSWAGHLSQRDYRDFVVPVTARLVASLRKLSVPVIYYPGGGFHTLYETSAIECDVLATDWRFDLARVDALLSQQGRRCTLQGNLDPQLVLGSNDTLDARVHEILEAAAAFSPRRRHIFNVGHGLLPHTPVDAITRIIKTVREFELR